MILRSTLPLPARISIAGTHREFLKQFSKYDETSLLPPVQNTKPIVSGIDRCGLPSLSLAIHQHIFIRLETIHFLSYSTSSLG